MKRCLLLSLRVTGALCGAFVAPASARAGPDDVEVFTTVRVTNAFWRPSAGSVMWLSDWQLEAAASVFSSLQGTDSDYQALTGQPGRATAHALLPSSSASARADIDGFGIYPGLEASTEILAPPHRAFVSAFSSATALRDFMVTGGVGPVEVTFGFDYGFEFNGTYVYPDTDVFWMDATAVLRIADGVSEWNLAQSQTAYNPVILDFSGSREFTLVLEYERPYTLSLNVDPEETPIVPEPSFGLLLLAALAAWCGRARATPCLFSSVRQSGPQIRRGRRGS